MSKRCPEEFNPWPPFVDIFASVILVLLLFVLILFVNVGYYSQFKFKQTNAGSIATDVLQSEDASIVEVDELLHEKVNEINNITKDFLEYIDLIEHIQKSDTSKLSGPKDNPDSVFSGGKSDGNAISRRAEKKIEQEQKVESKKRGEVIITFNNNELFVKGSVINKIFALIDPIAQENPNAKIELMVGDPQKIASLTLAKQISLGRILNMRNKLAKKGYGKDRIKIRYHKKDKLRYDHGYVQVKVTIP
jgi:hypothetical protein